MLHYIIQKEKDKWFVTYSKSSPSYAFGINFVDSNGEVCSTPHYFDNLSSAQRAVRQHSELYHWGKYKVVISETSFRA